jgi:hypothetical protein
VGDKKRWILMDEKQLVYYSIVGIVAIVAIFLMVLFVSAK